MTGELESNICLLCGGSLQSGMATVPFVLDNDTVVVIKNVPADICGDCHEPFTAGGVTDQIMALLTQLKTLRSEVSVVSYSEYSVA